jgi:murein tripeptide amidase MpaA
MPTNAIEHDRYYSYEELINLLKRLATDYPRLTKLSSIGQTFQGREIWLIEITNSDTGSAAGKPGYYIDAHIHAEEHVIPIPNESCQKSKSTSTNEKGCAAR